MEQFAYVCKFCIYAKFAHVCKSLHVNRPLDLKKLESVTPRQEEEKVCPICRAYVEDEYHVIFERIKTRVISN